MSEYYRGQRTRNIYDPKSLTPFKISRSKLDLFLNCPRCFYVDRRLGVGHPPGFPFNLNSAVDTLLKKEFDHYREVQQPHPMVVGAGIDAIPFKHEKLEEWRDSLRRGIQFLHTGSNLILTGGVDDVWINPMGELIIVDYKATSKNSAVNLDADWQIGYKRQMEVYQWLFRQNGFMVHNVGYFVYCNGKTDRARFDGHLQFDISILPYRGTTDWVDQALLKASAILKEDSVPAHGPDCDYCTYLQAIQEVCSE